MATQLLRYRRRTQGQSDFLYFLLAFCNMRSMVDMIIIVGTLGLVIITLQYRSLVYLQLQSVYNKTTNLYEDQKIIIKDSHGLLQKNMAYNLSASDVKTTNFTHINKASNDSKLEHYLNFTYSNVTGNTLQNLTGPSSNRSAEDYYELEIEDSLIPSYNETEMINQNITYKEFLHPKHPDRYSIKSLKKGKPEKRKVIRIQLGKKKVDLDNEKYKEESKTFSHPLNIDLKFFVTQKMKHGKDIPHKPINDKVFSYTFPPPKCHFNQSTNGNKNAIVLVKSSVHHFNIRKALRRVWQKQNPKNMKMVFLVGTNTRYHHLVQAESDKNHDIIQQNFYDAYMNNTFKTVMAFDWTVKYCSSAVYVIFIDDDFYVLYNELYHYIQQFSTENLLRGALVVDPIPYRDKFFKWYVSREEYAPNLYPDYLSGGIFVVSMSVAQKFLLAFPYVKYFGVDDAYLGIVAYKLGIIPVHDFHFQEESGAAFAIQCSHNPKNIVSQACDLAKGRLYQKSKEISASTHSHNFGQRMRFILHVGFLISFLCFVVFYFNLDKLIITYF